MAWMFWLRAGLEVARKRGRLVGKSRRVNVHKSSETASRRDVRLRAKIARRLGSASRVAGQRSSPVRPFLLVAL